MSDEQLLRDALNAAVPEPPTEPGRGPSARVTARRTRRRRVIGVGATVLAIAVAVPTVRVLVDRQPSPGQLTGTVPGQGMAACRKLDGHRGLGSTIDVRIVDWATAAEWLRQTTREPAGGPPIDPSQVAGARSVTVCVMSSKLTYRVVVISPDQRAVVDSEGDYQSLGAVMQPLDQLWKGGAPTTDAPFRCPGRSTTSANDVSTTLPTGATAARICFGGGNLYTPRQVLTSDVDALVRAINASPLYYDAPNVTCSPPPGLYDYSLVFDYPSGTRTVTQEVCRGLALGPYTREGPTGELDKTFLSMLERQETATATPPVAPPCPAPSSDAPQGRGDLRHVVAARYCASGSTGPGQVLSHAQLSVLQQWGAGVGGATTEPEGPCTRPTGGWPHLSLSDAWGNSFTMTVECQRPVFAVRSDGRHPRVIYPLSFAGASVDHLLKQLAGS